MIKNQNHNVEMQIKAIELLNYSLNLPANPNSPLNNINFSISLDSKADASQKQVFVIVTVDIYPEGQSQPQGTISVSCVFEIADFDMLIHEEKDRTFHIPQSLLNILNSIAISTTRGVMFSTFKGTYLHGAVLPILDPGQFEVRN